MVFIIPVFAGITSCSFDAAVESGFSDGEGTGGSLARFTIANDHLYTVDHWTLKVFDIGNARLPEYKVSENINNGVETIFPLENKLFLGTSTGMYIYDVITPEQPVRISFFEHVYSCDPVVSDGDYAYVTLNSSNQRCWRWVNELQIVNLQNIENPTLLKQYEMVSPQGLAVRNDTLWICDEGLKIFDIKDKLNITLLYHFRDIQANDVILNNQSALVIGETGFVQYRLENDTIRKLSEINVEL